MKITLGMIGRIDLSEDIRHRSDWQQLDESSTKTLKGSGKIYLKDGRIASVEVDIAEALYIEKVPIHSENILNELDGLTSLFFSQSPTEFISDSNLINLYRQLLHNSWLLLGQLTLTDGPKCAAFVHLETINTTIYFALEEKARETLSKYIATKRTSK